jgi:S1-C subfamily serine protease
MLRYLSLAALCFTSCITEVAAADPPAPLSVKDLAAKVKGSIVVIGHGGREGGQQGLGTGFVIDRSGLIATNLQSSVRLAHYRANADSKSPTVKAVMPDQRSIGDYPGG